MDDVKISGKLLLKQQLTLTYLTYLGYFEQYFVAFVTHEHYKSSSISTVLKNITYTHTSYFYHVLPTLRYVRDFILFVTCNIIK